MSIFISSSRTSERQYKAATINGFDAQNTPNDIDEKKYLFDILSKKKIQNV